MSLHSPFLESDLRPTSSDMQVRIVLADDHVIVRRGLRSLLESRVGFSVVAEASDGREAVELALLHRPNVVVLDLSLPVLHGLEATLQIRKDSPETEVLIFTMHESEEMIRDVLQAGARGYLIKSESDAQILSAVESLARRRSFFSASVNDTLLDTFLGQPQSSSTGPLTARERQIVKLIAEGRSNKLIASHLDVSVKTVESHRSAAMRKLNLKSAADLVRYAVRNHLVQP